jgi:hypothetical protein
MWRRRIPEDDEVQRRSEEAIAQGVALRFRLLEASEHLGAFVQDLREELDRRRAAGGETP